MLVGGKRKCLWTWKKGCINSAIAAVTRTVAIGDAAALYLTRLCVGRAPLVSDKSARTLAGRLTNPYLGPAGLGLDARIVENVLLARALRGRRRYGGRHRHEIIKSRRVRRWERQWCKH